MSHLLSASTSGHPFGASSTSHAPPSILDLTRIDLDFAPFEDKCKTFLSTLDSFVANAEAEITSRKQAREQARKDEEKEKRRLEDEIAAAGSKESRLLQGEDVQHLESSTGLAR